MVKKLLKKAEFELIIFFLIHWHRIIPRNINYCSDRGYFPTIQTALLSILRVTQYWPKETLDILVRKRIEYLLKHDQKTDIITTPIMTKGNLRKLFFDALHKNRQEKIFVSKTSGTTGIPMDVVTTSKLETQYRIIRRRLFEFAGLNTRDEFIYPRTTPNPHFCKKNMYMIDDLETLIESRHSFFTLIETRHVRAIYAFPTVLSLLAEAIAKNEEKTAPLKAIFTAGENLSEKTRLFLEKSFDTEVFNFYASIEFSSIGQECKLHDGFHINQEFYFIEILGPDGIPCDHNKWGRIVITPLDPGIVPIFRYDTGDIGMILSKHCPCGRTLPLLKVDGRAPELISTSNGIISASAFKEALDNQNPMLLRKVEQYQLILHGTNLTFLVIPLPEFEETDENEICNVLKRSFQGKLDITVRISHAAKRVGFKTPLLVREKT